MVLSTSEGEGVARPTAGSGSSELSAPAKCNPATVHFTLMFRRAQELSLATNEDASRSQARCGAWGSVMGRGGGGGVGLSDEGRLWCTRGDTGGVAMAREYRSWRDWLCIALGV